MKDARSFSPAGQEALRKLYQNLGALVLGIYRGLVDECWERRASWIAAATLERELIGY